MDVKEILAHCDHTLLKQESTWAQINEVCDDGKKYNCASICIPAAYVKACAEYVGNSLKICTVIGFPHGSNETAVKVFEAERAMDAGATELDMVLNIGRLLSGEEDYVRQDIQAVVEAAHARGAIVKVILENAYLSDEQKVLACRLCAEAGAEFVKTSTGYAPSGATLEDVRLMRASVPDRMQVKAAGGVRTLDALLAFRAAGCARCGATATEAIQQEAERRFAEKGTLD